MTETRVSVIVDFPPPNHITVDRAGTADTRPIPHTACAKYYVTYGRPAHRAPPRAGERGVPAARPRAARPQVRSLRKRVFAGKDRHGSFPGAPAPPCVARALDDDRDGGAASMRCSITEEKPAVANRLYGIQ